MLRVKLQKFELRKGSVDRGNHQVLSKYLHEVIVAMGAERVSNILLGLEVMVHVSIVKLFDYFTYPQLYIVEGLLYTQVFESVSEYLLTWIIWHKVEVEIEGCLRNTHVHSHELLDLLGCVVAGQALN
jgi:hypothetical protein